MGNPVRLKILDELALGPLTLEDLSTRIALKTESIYHHIRILQQIELVEEFDPVRSGGPGRPFARFKLTGKTVAIQYPQRNYYMFSEMLFQHLSDLLNADDLEARLKSIGKGIGENIAKTLSSQYEIDDWSLDKIRKYFVEGYLRNMGLQPEVMDSSETELTYRQYNCLFLELAKKYPDQVCVIDEGIHDSLFPNLITNCKGTRLKCLGHGDDFCEYTVSTS